MGALQFLWLYFIEFFLLVKSSPSSADDGLLIGSFNVQVFGQKKSENEEVMKILVRIIRRYDIILIQEIRDKTDNALTKLLTAINSDGSPKFFTEISERLGSTPSKEQYAFLIRSDSGISVTDRFQYSNMSNPFERPPFSLRLRSKKSEIRDFVLTAIHTKPDHAVEEIRGLKEVNSNIIRKWKTDNILIMGDLNAGCSYASRTALKNLDIRKDPPFRWLIGDDADTTAAGSKCAYDRFIMTGDKFKQSFVAGSSVVFNFHAKFGLTQNQTLAVSDHYPIELRLKGASKFNQKFVEQSPNRSSFVSDSFWIVMLVLMACFLCNGC